MSKTPGHWPLKVTKVDDFFTVTTNQGNHYAKTFDPFAAHLISLAPDLLAALEAALEAVEYYDEREGAEKTLRQVRAAIAKATGGAK